MKAGFHRSHERIMQVDANGEKIIWGSTDGKDKHGGKDDSKSINLSTIIEVVSGLVLYIFILINFFSYL